MTPYQQRAGYAFKTRVSLPDGIEPHVQPRRRVCSCGTNDRIVADAMVAMLETFARRRYWAPIVSILTSQLPLGIIYDHYERDTLDELLGGLNDVDLDPLVAEWNGRGKKTRSDKYVRQVRGFIPAGQRFPRSWWRRKKISAYLAALPVSGPTKNRHRAALMQFGRWLMEREVCDINPVRDVQGFGEHDPRMVWYSREQAKALLAILPQPYAALEALMAGTGIEWQACARLRRGDVDLAARTVFARGGKNRWRTRTVRVTEDWCWPIIAAHIGTLLPNATAFPISEKMALLRHHTAARLAGLPASTLHDWRHSYAIWNRRDGVEDARIKVQLGHSPASHMLASVYAAYRPDATESATTSFRQSPAASTKRG